MSHMHSEKLIQKARETAKLTDGYLWWRGHIPEEHGTELLKRIVELSAELRRVHQEFAEWKEVDLIEIQKGQKGMVDKSIQTEDGFDTANVPPPLQPIGALSWVHCWKPSDHSTSAYRATSSLSLSAAGE